MENLILESIRPIKEVSMIIMNRIEKTVQQL